MRTNHFILLITLCLMMGCRQGTWIQIAELQVEMRKNPERIGVASPRFSWQLHTRLPNVMQTAYQIKVAASPEDLKTENNLVWNSGKIDSDQSILVSYAGKPLESGKAYFWQVTVWTNYKNSVQRAHGKWSMGLLRASDWKARWIGINDPENIKRDAQSRTRLSARYLRKDFAVSQNVKRAMLYISGVGSSVPYLNGQQVSDDVFAPLPTLYTTTVYCNTYNDPQSVGFKQIRMKPVFPPGLTKVNASYQSPYGLIKSEWYRNNDKFTWFITIPANTTATVELPASFNIRRMKEQPELLSFERTTDLVIIKLGSGQYEILSD